MGTEIHQALTSPIHPYGLQQEVLPTATIFCIGVSFWLPFSTWHK